MSKLTKIGLPPGGSTGEVLKKKTGTNYDVEWGTGGGGGSGSVTSVATTSPITGGTITTTGTIGITQANTSTDGYLSSTDWNTFNGKQNALTNPVTGTGTSGQVAYWSGTTTQTGSNNLFWDNANARLGIGTNAPAVTLDTRGLASFTGTTATDGGQLGSELLSTANWTLGSGWTGDFTAGFAHSSGTATLTNTLAAVNGNYYLISYTVTGRTLGSFTIDFGGTTTSGITATGSTGPRATSTGTLVITPTTDFNGTIVFSIKVISASSASVSFKNSAGTVTNEIRNSTSNTNTLIGFNAGSRNLNTNNTFIGNGAGQNNTTGNSNSVVGTAAFLNNTTGSNNVIIGLDSGRRISGGGNLTIANTSVFVGKDTRANADNESNQIVIGDSAIGLGSNTTVIGNSSTTYGRWWGNLLVGTSTNAGYALDVSGTARVQVTGGSILFGNLAANYPAISFNGTLSSTDYNFGSGTTDKTFFINAPTGFNVSIRNNNSERLSVTGTNTIFYPVTGGSIILGGTSGSYSGLSFNGTMSSTDYNFLSQATDKTLFINVPTGYSHKFRVNNVDVIQIDSASITFSDAKNIILNTTTGTKIGTATTQKLGFFNATPVVQPSSVTTSQGIADALTSLGLLSSSTLSGVGDDESELALVSSIFNYTQR